MSQTKKRITPEAHVEHYLVRCGGVSSSMSQAETLRGLVELEKLGMGIND